MLTEIIRLNEERNVTLTAYIQSVGGEYQNISKRPAILILPGGGYQYCSDREADPVAMPYLLAGFQVFILRYSVKKNAVWPNPLNDYEQAMILIRSKSDEWNLFEDKIAVIGFSAGGHLAAAAATMSMNRPNAAILGYAITGENVQACNPNAPDTSKAVDSKTCPCFIFSTRTDFLVEVSNSIDFMKALFKHDIAFESHIYAFGPHGFSTGDTSVQDADTVICKRASNWVSDSIGWLRDVLGEFGSNGLKSPVCKSHINGNHEAFLSVDCTRSHLMKNPDAKALIDKLLNSAPPTNSKQANDDTKSMFENVDMSKLLEKMVLRDLLSALGINNEVILVLDSQLNNIPNII